MVTSPGPGTGEQQLPAGLSDQASMNSDPIGAETLRRIYLLDNLNRWMWSRIEPWVGERILEGGCGTGTMTAFLLQRSYVCSVDLNAHHLDDMRERLGQPEHLETAQYDLQDQKLRDLASREFDTVVCLNVLEHVPDHEITLDNFHSLLMPKGRLVLLVPAYPSLYGTLDEGLSHCRRYGKQELFALLEQHRFSVLNHRYLNMFGILGWWLNGKVLKRNLLPSKQLNLYNRLVPLFMLIENLTGPPCGLSHVVCAERL